MIMGAQVMSAESTEKGKVHASDIKLQQCTACHGIEAHMISMSAGDEWYMTLRSHVHPR